MEILLFYVVIAVIFGFLGYKYAPTRGRDATLWGVICALTGFVGLILLFVIPPVPAAR